MKPLFKDIYIGRIIKDKVDEQGIGYAEFARRIGCARTTLYSIFNSKSIDVERLLIISEALNFNFIEEIYLKKHTFGDFPASFVQIPFKDGKIDFLHFPKDLQNILKDALKGDLS